MAAGRSVLREHEVDGFAVLARIGDLPLRACADIAAEIDHENLVGEVDLAKMQFIDRPFFRLALVGIGLFSLTSGCDRPPRYLVTAPLFESVVIHLGDGRSTRIEAAPDVAETGVMNGLTIDGQPAADFTVRRDQLRDGTMLVIR